MNRIRRILDGLSRLMVEALEATHETLQMIVDDYQAGTIAKQEASLLAEELDHRRVIQQALDGDWPGGMSTELAEELLVEHRKGCSNLHCVTKKPDYLTELGVMETKGGWARDLGQCMSDSDGDCEWPACPQNRDGEPMATGRDCPRVWPER